MKIIEKKNIGGFQPLQLKTSHPPTSLSDDVYKFFIRSKVDIDRKCKAYTEALNDKKQQALHNFELSQLSHQKALEMLETEIKESELWKNLMSELKQYLQAHSKSEVFQQFVFKQLISAEQGQERILQHGISPSSSSKSVFSTWKVSLLVNFDNLVVQSSKVNHFELNELQLLTAFFEQHADLNKHFVKLRNLVQNIENFQNEISSLVNRVHSIVSGDSLRDNADDRLHSLESIKFELEKTLEQDNISYLSQNWSVRCRELLEKLDELILQRRLEKEMSAASLGAIKTFPYIRKGQSMAIMINEIRHQTPSTIKTILNRCSIESQRNLDSEWEHIVSNVRAVNCNGSDNDRYPLYRLSTIIIRWSELLTQILQKGHETASQDFQIMTCQSIDLCLEKYASSSSVHDASFAAMIMFGLHQLLGKKARAIFTKILTGVVYSHSLVIPNLIQSEKSLMTQSPSLRDQSNFALVMGSIVGYSADNLLTGPLDISFGWAFLVRTAQQLFYIIHLKSQAPQSRPLPETVSIETTCLILFQFLQTAGYALYSIYQSKFEDCLRGLEETIALAKNTSSVVGSLREFIQTALRDHLIPPLYFNNQDPAIVNCTLLAGEYELGTKMFENLMEPKDGHFATQCKQLGLGRTRAIFNRISTTESSQHLASSQIIEKICESTKIQNPQILRYTFHKVIDGLLEAIQEESFVHLNQSQPVMFARVASMVCSELPELGRLLRSAVYLACPPLMPKVISEGVSEAEFLKSVGFRWKNVKGSEDTQPEALQSWMVRIEKITTVVSVMSIQPEQCPFNIKDIWTLLVRLTNYVNRLPQAPFYLPSIYNIILRIASPMLFEMYGNHFVGLVKLIDVHVYSKLEDGIAKGKLRIFLDSFIKSNGMTFEKFFSQHED